jgi:hypothetical protein
MRRTNTRVVAVMAGAISLTACVVPPVAPTVPVAPGPNKSFAVFAADQAACEQYAAAQTGPDAAAANNQAVGVALLGTALGAGLGAGIGAAVGNAGKGAAIGAASGGALGILGNAGGAPAQIALQQEYDVLYAQCMSTHGNNVPGFASPSGTPPYAASGQAPYAAPPGSLPYGAPPPSGTAP